MKDGPGDHWLYRWIDEFDVDDHQRVGSVLKSPTAIARLYEIASEEANDAEGNAIDDPSAVVAGRTLDLASPYGCQHPDCQKDRLGKALLSVWHYFDRIVLAGPVAHHTLRIIESPPSPERQDDLLNNVERGVNLLLYIRSVRAHEHIYFREKGWMCLKHVKKPAAELGLRVVNDRMLRRRLAEELGESAEVKVFKNSSESFWRYRIRHAVLSEPFNGIMGKKKPTRKEALEKFLVQASEALVQDVHMSKEAKLPLVQEVRTSWFGADSTLAKNVENVALSIRLPTLNGVDTGTLLAIMRDERPQLEKFRSAIRIAVEERIRNSGELRSEEIGRKVRDEVIAPSIADIELRLAAAKRSLSKKSATGIAVGAAMVTIGLIAAMPMIVGLGATAAASPLLDAKKYLDDRTQIELSDMYFLWNLYNSTGNSLG